MELVEVYRDYEITYGDYKGRMMFRAASTRTFNLESARKAIDETHFTEGFRLNYLTIGEYNNHHIMYSKIQTYSFGEAYSHYLSAMSHINKTRANARAHQIQVI